MDLVNSYKKLKKNRIYRETVTDIKNDNCGSGLIVLNLLCQRTDNFVVLFRIQLSLTANAKKPNFFSQISKVSK